MELTRRMIVAASCLAALAAPATALDAASKCEAAKLKVAGKYNFCRLKAKAKEVKTLIPADYAKCDAKYGLKWMSSETKAGPGVCPTEGDETAIKDAVSADADTIALKLSGVRFVDDFNWTVSDLQTGLMWAKTVDDFSLTGNLNTWTWTDDTNLYPNDPDGTAFAFFLFLMNNGVSADGTTISGCFSGYCDWRLPTVAELQTILLEPFPCGTNPCIDPIFGPPGASYYWSSTPHSSVLYNAWSVRFSDGSVNYHPMNTPSRRAPFEVAHDRCHATHEATSGSSVPFREAPFTQADRLVLRDIWRAARCAHRVVGRCDGCRRADRTSRDWPYLLSSRFALPHSHAEQLGRCEGGGVPVSEHSDEVGQHSSNGGQNGTNYTTIG